MKRSIRIAGMGGQGIGYAAHIIGEALTEIGFYTAIHHAYGAEVRGGKVYSDIIYSDKPIISPFIEAVDYALLLHDIGFESIANTLKENTELIVDDTLCREIDVNIKIIKKPFYQVSQREKLPLNIVAIGYLAKKCELEKEAFLEIIRRSGKKGEDNYKAFIVGYKL